MGWQPVEYRETCGRVQGRWTVQGMAKSLPPRRIYVCRFRDTWPAGHSPQSQPARTHWFRDRLFWWYGQQVSRAGEG